MSNVLAYRQILFILFSNYFTLRKVQRIYILMFFWALMVKWKKVLDYLTLDGSKSEAWLKQGNNEETEMNFAQLKN